MPDGTEAVVVTNKPQVKGAVNSRNESVDLETKKMEIEEQLIDEVFKRSALWNFKLSVTERSPQIKKQLWEEVYEAMNGTFPSVEAIKKKWKSLSDSFRVHSKKNQQPSGSAASGKKPWVHLQHMQFLNDMRLESRTVSNIETVSELDDTQSNSLESNVFHDDSNSCNSSSNSHNTSHNPLDRIANSLESSLLFNMGQIEQIEQIFHRLSQNIPPTFDKPASMVHLISVLLHDIDPELLDEVMFDILKSVGP
ncbi:PREDICTED: uncharacterized protein LOC108777279 [Cyphomyrmex costatus]|uniref:uncharacterized protein LOC108777279 n=1 Tax=Cyphomyrmex costatus TaxID=456900 RepID=UPI0008523D2A|nr:PREDICTED: uncharacterized protein LOC108777279 [Cyphomyrmex costatus]